MNHLLDFGRWDLVLHLELRGQEIHHTHGGEGVEGVNNLYLSSGILDPHHYQMKGLSRKTNHRHLILLLRKVREDLNRLLPSIL